MTRQHVIDAFHSRVNLSELGLQKLGFWGFWGGLPKAYTFEEIQPIEDPNLPIIKPFCLEFLPPPLAGYVKDVSERVGCAPEVVAINLLVMLGGIIGRQVMVQPKERDDTWVMPANIWGAIAGDPGNKKSPIQASVFSLLKPLKEKAALEYEQEQKAYQAALMQYNAKKRQYLNKPNENDPPGDEPSPPVKKRYETNKATEESLALLLSKDPKGLILTLDELGHLLASFKKKGNETIRDFLLKGWSGTQSNEEDTISRGETYVPAVCLSIIGNITKKSLRNYAKSLAVMDDGFLQRFLFMLWIDDSQVQYGVDREPNKAVYERVQSIVNRLANFVPDGSPLPAKVLRYTPEAQELFNKWARLHEQRRVIASEAERPFVSKLPDLVCRLALIDHMVIDDKDSIGVESLQRAIAFDTYLEGHRKQVLYYLKYGDKDEATQELLERIRAKKLNSPFTASEVKGKDWKGLSSESVEIALDLLTRANIVVPVHRAHQMGGRPTTDYHINPMVWEGPQCL